MKKILLISLILLSFASDGQMITKPWMKTNLTVISQGRTNGYTIPSYRVLVRQNGVHRRLHRGSVWADLDVFWILANDGGQDYARLNHKDPTTFLMTLVNSPTFTSNVGFASNGTTSYEDTNWAPSNGVGFTQNDASWFCEVVDNLQSGGWAFGTDDVSNNTRRVYLLPRTVGDTRNYALNATASLPVTTVLDGHGFFHCARTSSTTGELFAGNASVNTFTTTSATRSTRTIIVNARHVFDNTIGSHYTGNVGSIGFGKNMSVAKRTVIYDAFHVFYFMIL